MTPAWQQRRDTRRATEIGHNSVDQSGLQIIIERIERLEEEKKGVAEDIRDVYSEALSLIHI